MVDQAVFLRTGQAGAKIEGTPGHVLTIQADGKVKPEPVASSSTAALRAKWAFTSSVTFNASYPSPNSVIAEPGTFDGVAEGDTVFVPPAFALKGAFHSGSAAPEFGGLYVVSSVSDDSASFDRDPRMATAEQIAAVALVSAEQGSGAGIYQVATPAAAVINVDPQVMPQVALPPHEFDGNTYFLVSQGNQSVLSWQIGSVNSP